MILSRCDRESSKISLEGSAGQRRGRLEPELGNLEARLASGSPGRHVPELREGNKVGLPKSVRSRTGGALTTYGTVSYGYVGVFARPMTSVMRIALPTGHIEPPGNPR